MLACSLIPFRQFWWYNCAGFYPVWKVWGEAYWVYFRAVVLLLFLALY